MKHKLDEISKAFEERIISLVHKENDLAEKLSFTRGLLKEQRAQYEQHRLVLEEQRCEEDDIELLTHSMLLEEPEWEAVECSICGRSAQPSGKDAVAAAKCMYEHGWRERESSTYQLVGLMCPTCVPKRNEPEEEQ